MNVALIHEVQLPVQLYGGTERVIWWLAKGLKELGVSVTLACRPGSRCPFADVKSPDFSKPIEPQLPGIDVFHYFFTPSYVLEKPHVITIEGNGQKDEMFLPNTVFVSRNHAERHGASCFVYNGLDPDDYVYEEKKENDLIFLAKASWRVKNVAGAIRISRRANRPLRILGGSRWWLPKWRGVSWEGMVGGKEKAEIVAKSKALLFPVRWHEPFGIAVIEALASGSPVFASAYGSLPELVAPEVGAICKTEDEFVAALGNVNRFRARDCREWVLKHFTYQHMARRYLELYEKTLAGEALNASSPKATQDPQALLSLS